MTALGRHGFDVVIVGAGPAGASLAIRVARAGYAVALVDRAQFPRSKPCGEFMSPSCVPMLAELGLDVFDLDGGTARGHEVSGMRLSAFERGAVGRYRAVGRAAPPTTLGIGIRRELLDANLVELARAQDGVTVLEGHAALDLERERGGRIVGVRVREPDGSERTLRASVTVGADGLRSRVARSLGVVQPIPWLNRFALVTRYAGVDATDFGELHLFDGGYFAAVDVDAGLFTLNLVVDGASLPKGRAALDAMFDERLQRVPVLAERLRSARRFEPLRAYGPLGVRTKRQVFEGAVLVGDAAGYVDPMTGEGIYLALRGADLLTDALRVRFETGNERRAWRQYTRARRHEIAPKLAMSLLLQRAIRKPWLVERFARLVERRPGLLDFVVSLTGDYVPLREALSPGTLVRAWSSS
ncbi:MAG: NAD(P)/FAD-dependent oxidoreductase [Planctomycetes bacterium]|nr:NAD(P)/FAD-dependent oxidoreductase [Planctomycetota bacterium]MCB9919205.1 NAD(P)/FAD-dependent oxidoreductase [Planctomycetota bacterium]